MSTKRETNVVYTPIPLDMLEYEYKSACISKSLMSMAIYTLRDSILQDFSDRVEELEAEARESFNEHGDQDFLDVDLAEANRFHPDKLTTSDVVTLVAAQTRAAATILVGLMEHGETVTKYMDK